MARYMEMLKAQNRQALEPKQSAQQPNPNVRPLLSHETKIPLVHSCHEERVKEATDKSNEASEHSFANLRGKRNETYQSDQDTCRDLDKIIKELREMKKIHSDLHLDKKNDHNPYPSKSKKK